MSTHTDNSSMLAGNIEGLAGLLSAVLAQTGSIQAADNAVDGKAHNLMAAALVFIALLGVQLRDGDGTWRGWAVGAILIQIVTIGMVMYLTRGRKYKGAVVDLSIHKEYFAKDDELLLTQLVEDAAQANRYNTQILQDKTQLFGRAELVFLGGFALGVLALFVVR